MFLLCRFFLYVFLAALAILLLVGAQQLVSSLGVSLLLWSACSTLDSKSEKYRGGEGRGWESSSFRRNASFLIVLGVILKINQDLGSVRVYVPHNCDLLMLYAPAVILSGILSRFILSSVQISV